MNFDGLRLLAFLVFWCLELSELMTVHFLQTRRRLMMNERTSRTGTMVENMKWPPSSHFAVLRCHPHHVDDS
eukprot:scaffold11470_cov99-Cylindrotheca_fusiformis.AAC.1